MALLDELAALAPIDGVAGNCDGWDVAARMPAEQSVEIGDVRVALVHDPGPERDRRARLRARFPVRALSASVIRTCPCARIATACCC